MRMLSTPAETRTRPWVRPALAIAVVGIATALGAVLGLVVGALARQLWPAVGRTTIEVLLPLLGFNLGWWWYASVGQRWMVQGRRDPS